MNNTDKKKIIIVNNNMKIGGVQKSLCNLLWAIHNEYEVTLCVFNKCGLYLNDIPSDVKIIEINGPFRYLGLSQNECKSILDKVKRGILALICKIFGRTRTLKLMLKFEREYQSDFDCAIAFLHNGREKSFYGGVQEYVLKRVNAKRKIAFLHCDYKMCGANNEYNDHTIEQFDMIAACSDGCRNSFTSALPHLAEKCITVKNCHRYDELRMQAEDEAFKYDNNSINFLIVSRLSHEKGIDRAIEACAKAYKKGYNINLHIVGDGAMRDDLQAFAERCCISERVIFHGENCNPYRYMKNADLLLMTSYHEAAPMVIDEAISLGLPVLTTKTISSLEMVENTKGGWVCENNNESFEIALEDLLKNPQKLKMTSDKLKNRMSECNNDDAVAAFRHIVTDEN